MVPVKKPKAPSLTKTMEVPTEYMHKEGPIVISQGIGKSGWFAMIRKSNGSLKRFKPIYGGHSVAGIRDALERYTGKAIWKKEESSPRSARRTRRKP